MTWDDSAPIHAVQFYEGESFLHRSIAEFFGGAFRAGHSIAMLARRRTFESVSGLLNSQPGVATLDASNRIVFVDADEALATFTDGATVDASRFRRCFTTLLTEIEQRDGRRPVRMYGEMVDVLCKAGNHAGALRVEELWNDQLGHHRIAVMCGYALDSFDGETHTGELRRICRQHTHVVPAEGVTDALDDRARTEEIAVLQHRGAVLERLLKPRRASVDGPAAGTATVYVIDDEPSVRRSLARLLTSVDFRVQTFASGESFLAEVDRTASGCLILDIHLEGMSGLQLQRSLAGQRWSLPIIAITASDDVRIEAEARGLGASAFFRKPLDTRALLDAVARATPLSAPKQMT